jgi:hypothetical protein
VDPAILAASVGNALIVAITTDAWQQVRSAIVGLWRRAYPQHPQHAQTIDAVLSETRDEILAARQLNNLAAERELVAEWQHRLIQLMQFDQDISGELQRVLDEVISPALGSADSQVVGSIAMTATATGHGRVYQAQVQNIIER